MESEVILVCALVYKSKGLSPSD